MIEVRIAQLSYSIPDDRRAEAFAALREVYDEFNEYDDGSDSTLLNRIDVLPHRCDGSALILGSNYDYVEQDEITQLLGALAPFAVEGSRVVFCSRDVDEDWGYRVAGGELCEEIRHTVVVLDGPPTAAAQAYRDAAGELLSRAEALDTELAVNAPCMVDATGAPVQHRWRLAEDGYTRTWLTRVDHGKKKVYAMSSAAGDFGDEGDGDEYLECVQCAQAVRLDRSWAVEYL